MLTEKMSVIILYFALLSVHAQADQLLLFAPSGANFYVYHKGNSTFYLNQARATELKIGRLLEKLSSGKRINRAGDDPAGLAVAEKITSIVNEMKRTSMNHADWRNYQRYREVSLAHSLQALQRMRELAVRASGGILGPDDREMIQPEIDQLIGSIDANARFSQFNKIAVIEECTAAFLGVADVTVVRSPHLAIGKIDEAIRKVNYLRTTAGVQENIMTWRIEGVELNMVNTVSALSRISDADMAEEISTLVNQGMLLQTQYGAVLQKRP